MASNDDNNPLRFLKFWGNQQPAAPAAPHPKEGVQTSVTHKVVWGDTIEKIAEKYKQEPEVIIQANALKNAESLAVGQVITVPLTYRIKEGDTLYKIAQKFNTTIRALQDLNGISNPDRIAEGDVLVVPATSETSNAGTGMLK